MSENPSFYFICADFSQGNLNPKAVHNFIRYCPLFSRWWNNIPLIWIVESAFSASQITSSLKDTFDGTNFLVAKIAPQQMDGFLPQYAWDWFSAERAADVSEMLRRALEKPVPSQSPQRRLPRA